MRRVWGAEFFDACHPVALECGWGEVDVDDGFAAAGVTSVQEVDGGLGVGEQTECPGAQLAAGGSIRAIGFGFLEQVGDLVAGLVEPGGVGGVHPGEEHRGAVHGSPDADVVALAGLLGTVVEGGGVGGGDPSFGGR